MAREYFKCFHSYFEKTKSLTDAEVGRLFRALLKFSATGEAPSLAGRESIAFDFIAEDIDRDSAAYSQKCKVNAENGSLGGKRTVANGSERKRTEAKSSESDKIEDIRDKTIKEIPTNVGTKKSSAFHAPTVEEVRSYCQERKNGIDPEAFVNYYENRGWYLSKGIKMRDWKRAVITWEKNGFDKPKKQNPALKYEQKPIPEDDFNALVVDLGDV